MLRFGYNTNGFAHHRLEDAVQIIADLGYRSVALTLDHFALNPFDRNLHRQMGDLRSILERHQLTSVIETGARYLLDARRKHWPTLISPEPWQREYRLEFLKRAVWIAEALGSSAVSFWSGKAEDAAPRAEQWQRLVDGCRALCDLAAERNVDLAFEPEPGMLVDTTPGFEELSVSVNDPRFGLTLDVGHLLCMWEPIIATIHRVKDKLKNVHLEDMHRGVHDHLMFGEGEIDFGPVLGAFESVQYPGGIHVELSRHSHDAVETARKSLAFLREL